MARQSRFWDRLAQRYSKQPISDLPSYEKKLEVTQSYLRPDMQMLELGCGTGSTAVLHAPHVKNIHAVDISQKMIEIARENAIKARVSNVKFYVAPIKDFVAPEGGYDVVMAMSVLHLVEDRDALIGRVYDMLKPGGLFISSTICMGDTMKFFKLIAPVGQAIGLLPLLRVFSQDELRDSLKAVGFTIEHDWCPGTGKALFLVARKQA